MDARLLAAARLEFLEAQEFYRERSSRLAEDFVSEFERLLNIVRSIPLAGSPFREGTRRVLMRQFPFAVIYQVDSDHVLVVAVAHQRRRPGYWRDRV